MRIDKCGNVVMSADRNVKQKVAEKGTKVHESMYV